MKRIRPAVLLLLLLLLVPCLGAAGSAGEKEARDITKECLLNGFLENQNVDKMRDGKYRTVWESKPLRSEQFLTIEAPEGETIGALLLCWRTFPLAVDIQRLDEATGEWVTELTSDADFNAQYVPIPEMTKLRIIGHDGINTALKLCEIRIMTPGTLPEDFQVWQKPSGQADLLLIHAHPDDEVLWFGGLLPLYAGEKGLNVVVACAAFNSYDRRLELLTCLWTCGVRNYPVFMAYEDHYTSSLNAMYKFWKRKNVIGDIAALYRRFRPKVVVLHDLQGEYGHGAHRALSDCGMSAVAVAADPEQEEASVLEWGVWDVPKVYVHLWKEDQIQMDWNVPLKAFGGKTAMEVAREGFACHVSQAQKGRWAVLDGGLYDNSLFGLFHTTVGPDVRKNDLFEHITEAQDSPNGYLVQDE